MMDFSSYTDEAIMAKYHNVENSYDDSDDVNTRNAKLGILDDLFVEMKKRNLCGEPYIRFLSYVTAL